MIPHNCPTFTLAEQVAAARVIDSGWVAQGAEVEAFENELCEFFDIPNGHAIAVSSGSAALYLALWVLNGNNKRIGLPVYACSALRNAIGLVNGKAFYIDCAAGSPNMDLSAVSQMDIDILIAPSMFGIPVEIPDKRNFKVIEDIAQSFGAIVGGQRIGLRGDVGICSFSATKLITSGGQGGAVISNNKAIIDKLKDYLNFDCRYDALLRFNFQMTDLQAAIGRVQLEKLPVFLAQREKIFSIYQGAGLNLLSSTSESHCPVRYRAVMRCKEPLRAIEELANQGVRAIIPINTWELLDNKLDYSMANQLTSETISLPIYPSLFENAAKNISRVAIKYS